MILSFLPVLMGGRSAAAETGTAQPASTPTPATGEGLGFGALFLALLGGDTAPIEGAQAPADSAELDVSSEGAAVEPDGSEGRDPKANVAGASCAEARGGAATPWMSVANTTRAGWATLGREATPTEGAGELDSRVALGVRTLRTEAEEGAPDTEASRPATDAPAMGIAVGARRMGMAPASEAPTNEVAPAVTHASTVEAAPVILDTKRIEDTGRTDDGANDASDVRATADVTSGDRTETAAAASPPAVAAAAPVTPFVRPVDAPSSVTTVDRDLSHLDPAFRDKVERVMDRMADEHGVDVRLVEGYRTPERQRHLFAQGRSRPGPVVTWTTHSNHSEGRAADLQVEDAAGRKDAYSLLQQTAQEEGLNTLGMKDPGHVELSTDGEAASDRAGSLRARPEHSYRRPTPTRPVAETAQVATAARTARPVGPAHVASVAHTATVAPVGVEFRAAVKAEQPARGTDGKKAPRVEKSDAADAQAAFAPSTRMAHAGPSQPVAPAQGVVGADTLARVEQILDAQDVAGLAPQRVTVRLDGTAGPVERVRVDMIGSALRGDVTVSDPRLADGLRGDASEILRTLREHGYDPQSLSINQVRAADAARDGWGGALRTESAADALRALVGAQPGTQFGANGRDPSGRGHEQQSRHESQQGGFNQQSRRDGKKESR